MKSLIILFLGILVYGQEKDEDLLKKIKEIFPENGGLELVPTKAPETIGALEKCGEGASRGRKLCVKYHQCNATTNTITQTGVTDGFGMIDIRLRVDECDHFLDVCCNIPPGGLDPSFIQPGEVGTSPLPPNPATPTPATPAPVTEAPPVLKPSFCGIRNPNGIDFKITGNMNNEAEYGEFPWVIAILNRASLVQNIEKPLICGGSLITPNVVLTGAHCVDKFKFSDLVIRAGEWDTQTTRERLPYQERSVKQIIIHEGFNPGNLYNDFALVILTESINKADNVGTICLPPQNSRINSRNCFVSGWGKDSFGKQGRYQSILKKIELPTIERRICQDALRSTRLGPQFGLHSSFMCAGGEMGKDACTGDGGSPLVCPDPQNPSRYVQVGIVAWGIGCGTLNVPGVYADVTKFRDWIDQNLRRLNINNGPYTI